MHFLRVTGLPAGDHVLTIDGQEIARASAADWQKGLTISAGPAELAGPDDPLDGVDAERLRLLLREIFTAAGGTHEDFGAYDRAMAAERRTAILVTPARVYRNR